VLCGLCGGAACDEVIHSKPRVLAPSTDCLRIFFVIGKTKLVRLKGMIRGVFRGMRRPPRKIDLGDLDRLEPFCRHFGFRRGNPIDRYFIEQFLEQNATLIAGRTLELLNNSYTKRYGGDRVTHSDVLDINPANGAATIHDDLRTMSTVPDSHYDCVILTQTLQLIDDDESVLRQIHRILKPKGRLLLTVPCISKVGRQDIDGTYYRFYTDHGIRFVLDRAFQPSNYSVEYHGNVMTATAFLYGLAVHEITPMAFERDDPEFPLIVGVVARKV
jgi:SAM-dependent methyltransferase